MKKCILFLLFPLLVITLYSQEFRKDFGKVSIEEITMANYIQDKTADAVVLFDKGVSEFVATDDGFEVLFHRETRIKIFNEAGLPWAEIQIPFYREGDIFEKITEIEAQTYNLENNQIQTSYINKTDYHDEKVNEYWNSRKFAMPAARAGSVIEYKYTLRSQYVFNLRDWEFQWRIPVIYSEYKVKMIPYYEYTWLLQGSTKFSMQRNYPDPGLPRQFGSSSYHEMINEFAMKNVPAFGDEEYISSYNDYVIKLDFQLDKINYASGGSLQILSTWPDMVKDFLKDSDFGKYAKKSEKMADNVINLPKLLTLPPEARFDSILTYVKSNYNWNRTRSKIAHKSPSDLVKDKYGNSAEINLFTVGLLNAAGIEAYPMLLSTRDNGRIKTNYPFQHFFNYVAVYAKVNGNVILTDATEVMAMNNRIPPRCINDKALLIKEENKGEVSWINLDINRSSDVRTNILMTLDGNSFKAIVNSSLSEYDALLMRNKYVKDPVKFLDKPDSEYYHVIDTTIKVNNVYDCSKRLGIDYTAIGKMEQISNKLYIAPFPDETITVNPLTKSSRSYPIDLIYPQRKSLFCQLEIPEGYSIDYLPPSYKISNELFELNYNAIQEGNKVTINLVYFFQKATYAPDTYLKVKSYFQDIVKKENDKIVLVKNQ